MLSETITFSLLIIIALIYAAFDTFNRRNIPNAVAYAGLIIAILVTLTYPQSTLIYSIVVAAIVGIIFYALYKLGQVGAGDGFELVTLSLLVPIQPTPLLSSIQPLLLVSTPFILSVFVATGIITIIGVPIYYLLINKSEGFGSKETKKEKTSDLIRASMVLVAYIFLYVVLATLFGPNIYGAALILIVGIFSALILMYSKRINAKMVTLKPSSALEEGDIIATNMMDPKTLEKLTKKYKNFGKLADKKLIKDLKKLKTKLPVYDNSVPLSLSIFFAVIVSLVLGNLLFLLI